MSPLPPPPPGLDTVPIIPKFIRPRLCQNQLLVIDACITNSNKKIISGYIHYFCHFGRLGMTLVRPCNDLGARFMINNSIFDNLLHL